MKTLKINSYYGYHKALFGIAIEKEIDSEIIKSTIINNSELIEFKNGDMFEIRQVPKENDTYKIIAKNRLGMSIWYAKKMN